MDADIPAVPAQYQRVIGWLTLVTQEKLGRLWTEVGITQPGSQWRRNGDAPAVLLQWRGGPSGPELATEIAGSYPNAELAQPGWRERSPGASLRVDGIDVILFSTEPGELVRHPLPEYMGFPEQWHFPAGVLETDGIAVDCLVWQEQPTPQAPRSVTVVRLPAIARHAPDWSQSNRIVVDAGYRPPELSSKHRHNGWEKAMTEGGCVRLRRSGPEATFREQEIDRRWLRVQMARKLRPAIAACVSQHRCVMLLRGPGHWDTEVAGWEIVARNPSDYWRIDPTMIPSVIVDAYERTAAGSGGQERAVLPTVIDIAEFSRARQTRIFLEITPVTLPPALEGQWITDDKQELLTRVRNRAAQLRATTTFRNGWLGLNDGSLAQIVDSLTDLVDVTPTDSYGSVDIDPPTWEHITTLSTLCDIAVHWETRGGSGVPGDVNGRAAAVSDAPPQSRLATALILIRNSAAQPGPPPGTASGTGRQPPG